MLKKARSMAKRALYSVGLEVQRSRQRTVRLSRNAGTAGKRIEMVGPSGVGKSTTVARFAELSRGTWLGRSDIQAYDMAGVGKVDDAIHRAFLIRKHAELAGKDFGLREIVRSSSYYGSILLNDLKAASGTFGQGVVLDEGLCQVFARELLDLPVAEFEIAMRGRAIVVLGTRDPAKVVRQIRKRTIETGRIRTVQAGVSDEELLARVGRGLVRYDRLVARAEPLGVPVLKLMAEDGVEANAARLDRFARSF